ncbi:MAG: CocE/NonD family hydrolase [Bryobacteraceae bacterium]
MFRIAIAAASLLAAGGASLLPAQGLDYIKAHYTKHEFRIPMRDGVKLFTAVYTPKDGSRRQPFLMTRTPYSLKPYGVDQYRESLGPSEAFAKSGYIFVYQDVRGRWMSEGEYMHIRPYIESKTGKQVDEASDTFDTIDWLVKNVPGNNGRAGIWGISYPGFYTAMGAIDAHPAVKAVSPQAPVTDWFIGDDFHHNGAFFLAHAFNFLIRNDKPRPEPVKKIDQEFDYGTPNGYEFYLRIGALPNADERYLKSQSAFWREMMKHPNYDEFWQSRDLRRGLRKIQPAVMTVGGWFDAEDVYGPLRIYDKMEKTDPASQNVLVMGPWYHGQWSRDDGDHLGNVSFNAKTGAYYREKIEFPFFEHHLKDALDPKLPEAYVFETGTNTWRMEEAWPPKAARPRMLYFHDGGRLVFDTAPAATDAFDEYRSDPRKPVPFIDYFATGMTREYMTDDQRHASTRPDVLVYQTEPLDGDVTLAGPFTASLQVSVTGTDADFVVKLVDVYPDDYPDPKPNPKGIRMGGYQQLVRGEPFRGRFRNSFSKPEPFEPGKLSKVEFELPDIYHTFRREHRIMVQVQSTWFPLVDRNPQKFVDIYNARETDFQAANHRVYRGRANASHLKVLVRP